MECNLVLSLLFLATICVANLNLNHGVSETLKLNKEHANFTVEQMFQMTKTFFDNYMYPSNVQQAKTINSTLFAPNIQGRVDLTRTFDGPELNTEYLFGLFTNVALNPTAFSVLGYPFKYDIVHFAASQNVAATSAIVYFNFTSLNAAVPIEIDTWNVWNKHGQITEYDATFRWFDYLFDTLIASAMPLFNATNTNEVIQAFQERISVGICTTAQDSCNGTNQQYDSFDSCYDFLTTKTRFGRSYELVANTVLCRMVHENMVPYRPDVHCPHIGPAGGHMCVDDYTYESKVLQPYFTNAPMVPFGLGSSNKTVAAML